MVLPVAYTKGLEFDAVLLFNPTEENYPNEDKYVKLLYVAATRALHECAVLHRGNLSELIRTKAPEGKHQNELSAPTLTKAKEYERVMYTEKELQEQQKREGAKDMMERTYIGPRRIVIPESQKPDNGDNCSGGVQQSTAYGSMPGTSSELMPKGHKKSDFSVRWVKKDKKFVELVSSAGVLRLTPIAADIVRVTFQSGQLNGIHDNYWKVQPKSGLKWTLKEMRDMVDLVTDSLIVRVERRNGAVRFLKTDKTLVLSEKLSEPRQMEKNENWVYFDWGKKEKLKSKGLLKDDYKIVTGKASYISLGCAEPRMPLLVSGNGYEIFVACEGKVLCCDIPMYGPYIYSGDTDQIDYYFVMGTKEDALKPYIM